MGDRKAIPALRYLSVIVVTFVAAGACLSSGDSYRIGTVTESRKGQWGRVVPIADNAHPNLYYNQREIDELRHMILVQRNPMSLYNRYNSIVKNVMALPFPNAQTDGSYLQFINIKAALSYMIEPTSAKADAIRATLLSFVNVFPRGLASWYPSPGPHFAGYYVPWMFDLIMAYNPERLSPAERANLKAWFEKSTQNVRFDTRKPYRDNSKNIVKAITREGKTMMPFPNWFSRYMGPSLACALMSGSQAAVDYWADSGWPHTLLTTPADIANYGLPPSVNRYDLVMYLLAVYPSGANSDTYDREGYRLPESDWYTNSYEATADHHDDGGDYHFAQMWGVMMAAEMAYHNGMTGVYGITDVAGEPAILRTLKRAIISRTEVDRRPTSLTGHPDVGYDPLIWLGYRRYSDPMIESAIPSLKADFGGVDFSMDVMEFFGYPRHFAWTPRTRQ
jgi:hypothetical protein